MEVVNVGYFPEIKSYTHMKKWARVQNFSDAILRYKSRSICNEVKYSFTEIGIEDNNTNE